MNELVRELAEQARAVPIGGAPRERALVGYENIEKFAELLIRECAGYVKNSNHFTYVAQADVCAESMKLHFGVK